MASALVLVLMMAALIVVLTRAAVPALKAYGPRFFTGTSWRANELEVNKRDATGRVVFDEEGTPVTVKVPAEFGALHVVYGTLASSAIALAVAVPLSLGTALFLIRIAPPKLAAPVSFLVEFLAAIPSLAYGIWGMFVLCPFLAANIESPMFHRLSGIPGLGWMFDAHGMAGAGGKLTPTGYDLLAGGLILAIMIIPIITALSRDILAAVPRTQVEGTTALGATWWQSSAGMLHYARGGLFGAIMLGLARAAGETMAVTLVIGNKTQIVLSPFAPAQTMSSLLANNFGEASKGDNPMGALMLIALLLLAISLIINIVARYLFGGAVRPAAAH